MVETIGDQCCSCLSTIVCIDEWEEILSEAEQPSNEVDDKEKVSALRSCLALFLGCLGVSTCIALATSKDDRQLAAEKKLGYRCLISTDVSHTEFKRRIRDLQREPDSFEHIETRLTKKRADGSHEILMKYRSRNGFGGMNISVASADMDNETCKISRIKPK